MSIWSDIEFTLCFVSIAISLGRKSGDPKALVGLCLAYLARIAQPYVSASMRLAI